jgi:hypothetical protein
MKTCNFFCEKLASWGFEKIYQGRPLNKFSLLILFLKNFAKE